MNTYCIYELGTGFFTDKTYSCESELLDINVPADCGCIMGVYDALSQKVDLNTGEVVAYQPAQPSENHVWDVVAKRWVYVKTDADIAAEVRAQRNRLLAECDWLSSRATDGIPTTPAWSAYRAALRDITLQSGFPRNVVWPSIPG